MLSWNFQGWIREISCNLRARLTVSWFTSTSLFCSIFSFQVECFWYSQYFYTLFNDKSSFLNKGSRLELWVLLLKAITNNAFLITTMWPWACYCDSTKSCTFFGRMMILSRVILYMRVWYWLFKLGFFLI